MGGNRSRRSWESVKEHKAQNQKAAKLWKIVLFRRE